MPQYANAQGTEPSLGTKPQWPPPPSRLRSHNLDLPPRYAAFAIFENDDWGIIALSNGLKRGFSDDYGRSYGLHAGLRVYTPTPSKPSHFWELSFGLQGIIDNGFYAHQYFVKEGRLLPFDRYDRIHLSLLLGQDPEFHTDGFYKQYRFGVHVDGDLLDNQLGRNIQNTWHRWWDLDHREEKKYLADVWDLNVGALFGWQRGYRSNDGHHRLLAFNEADLHLSIYAQTFKITSGVRFKSNRVFGDLNMSYVRALQHARHLGMGFREGSYATAGFLLGFDIGKRRNGYAPFRFTYRMQWGADVPNSSFNNDRDLEPDPIGTFRLSYQF